MQVSKAYWPLSVEVSAEELHPGATPSTNDVRQMTANVELQRQGPVASTKHLEGTLRNQR